MWHFIVMIFSSHPSDVALFLSFWIQNLNVMHIWMNLNYIYLWHVCCFTLLLRSAGQLIFCCCFIHWHICCLCVLLCVHCNCLTFNKSSETKECVCERVVDDFVYLTRHLMNIVSSDSWSYLGFGRWLMIFLSSTSLSFFPICLFLLPTLSLGVVLYRADIYVSWEND